MSNLVQHVSKCHVHANKMVFLCIFLCTISAGKFLYMAFLHAANWLIAMKGLLMHTNLTHSTQKNQWQPQLLNVATLASAKPPFLHRRSLWVRIAGREKATAKWSEGVGTKTLALWRDPAWGPPSGSLALSDTPPPQDCLWKQDPSL